MFAELPAQSIDLDFEASRFDATTTPRNLTVWDDSTADVVFQAAAQPQRFVSSNPRVATASPMPQKMFQALGNQDWPVEVSGHSPGAAIIDAVGANGRVIPGQSLEVMVLRRQEFFLTLHFVTDWLGGTTVRSAASMTATDVPLINHIFGPANINFVIHNSRAVNTQIHFEDGLPNVQELERRMAQVIRLGQQFDSSSNHFQIFCVPTFHWLDFVRPGFDVQGLTRGHTIIVEDGAVDSALAHELGHAMGLAHNRVATALMNEAPSGTFLTRADIRKIGMLR
jgi:hypothetical protein